MTRDEKNSLAYNDVLDRMSESYPNDEEYMWFYRQWLSIARYPEYEWIKDEYIEDR